jgi:hypothetical protein
MKRTHESKHHTSNSPIKVFLLETLQVACCEPVEGEIKANLSSDFVLSHTSDINTKRSRIYHFLVEWRSHLCFDLYCWCKIGLCKPQHSTGEEVSASVALHLGSRSLLCLCKEVFSSVFLLLRQPKTCVEIALQSAKQWMRGWRLKWPPRSATIMQACTISSAFQ